MTTKDFIAIAEVIRRIPDRDTRKAVADDMARTCKEFNSNFDRGRFLTYCRV